MLEDQIIRSMLQAWEDDQNHPHRGRTRTPLPDFADAKEMLEVAFLASLRREEDRPLQFTLVLSASLENELAEGTHSPDCTLRLEESLPLSVESLSKIASAFDPEISAFAVDRTHAEDKLRLWGVFTLPPRTHRFNEVPVAVNGELFFRPDRLAITVKQPGSLLVSRGASVLGRMINGQFVRASPTPFSSRAFGKHLVQMISQQRLFLQHGNDYWHLYRDALEYLLQSMAHRSHGSTLVLLSPTSGTPADSSYKGRYTLVPNLGLQRLFTSLLPPTKDILRGIAMRRLVHQRLDLMAQLSSIDGALVLSDELDVVSFGATLTAKPWHGKVISGPDGFGTGGGEVLQRQQYGTRHNSAIDFAGTYDGSAVFVVSQDGPIRAFLRPGAEVVLYWQDCTASMFV
jgi:hypothetical protein